jgi:thiamine-monophosphate kinase
MDERARIARLAAIFGAPAAPGVRVGIGDDAAVLDLAHAVHAPAPPDSLVWTIDEQVEGTHFRIDLASFEDIGWRSFMAAASDLAAMGAAPWCALGALVLPATLSDEAFDGILRGQRAAANAVGAPIVGGNLARGPVLSLATTLLGTCARPVERRGATPGDGVWMAGRVGLAAAGLRALLAGRGAEAALGPAVEAWRRPVALVAAGRALGPLARAAVDVSDGLAGDAGHLAAASGVALVLDEDALRGDPLLEEAAAAVGVPALDLALYGGEDYALVAASPTPIDGFRRIGQVVAGSGVALRGAHGQCAVIARGFDHFSDAQTRTAPGSE